MTTSSRATSSSSTGIRKSSTAFSTSTGSKKEPSKNEPVDNSMSQWITVVLQNRRAVHQRRALSPQLPGGDQLLGRPHQEQPPLLPHLLRGAAGRAQRAAENTAPAAGRGEPGQTSYRYRYFHCDSELKYQSKILKQLFIFIAFF